MSWNGKRVLLRSAFGTHSGYGRDGITLAQSLREQGAEVHVEPTNVTVPLPPDVAMLFAAPRPGRFDLMLHHQDPTQLAAPPSLRGYADRIVGWTMWEFTSFNGEEHEPDSDAWANYDTILAYDDVSREALHPYHPDVRVLQGGYQSKPWTGPIERDWQDTFRYCMVGALNDRKNPFAAIEAFRLLKDRHGDAFDAELHLKNIARTLHPGIEEWVPGVKVHYAPWTPEQMLEFYSSCHVYLAPSWGEGKNLPALEALTTGMTCIVSECGGHKQWFDPSVGWMLERSTWAEHDPVRKPGQKSLRVDVEELADLMWQTYNIRPACRQRGDIARTLIPAQCDWDAVVRRLDTLLS